MEHLRPGGVNRRPSPQLPAFCRTRRRVTTTVRLSTLQQLLRLLLLVVFLQLSTILLVLAGPAPAPLGTSPVSVVSTGAATTLAAAPRSSGSRQNAPVPLSSQP